jgi:Concanavalin A-like lectin/glucanases superfamily
MALFHSPSIVRNGIILHYDAANIKSYNTVTSTSTWFDISSSGVNGTLTNSPTFVTSASGVLNFSSSTVSYVNIPYNSQHEFLGLAPFTFELWIKPTEDPGINQYRRLVGHEQFGATRNGYTLYVNNSVAGSYSIVAERWVLSNSLSSVYFTVPSSSILGKWNHIVVVFDGSYNTMYQNGSIISGPVGVSSTATLTTTGVPLSLAAYYGTGSFSGDIGIFRVYNRGLSAVEVQQNYQAQRDRYGI